MTKNPNKVPPWRERWLAVRKYVAFKLSKGEPSEYQKRQIKAYYDEIKRLTASGLIAVKSKNFKPANKKVTKKRGFKLAFVVSVDSQRKNIRINKNGNAHNRFPGGYSRAIYWDEIDVSFKDLLEDLPLVVKKIKRKDRKANRFKLICGIHVSLETFPRDYLSKKLEEIINPKGVRRGRYQDAEDWVYGVVAYYIPKNGVEKTTNSNKGFKNI